MESRKVILIDLFAGKERRCTCREGTCGHSGEGEGRTNGESSVDVCTLSRVKQSVRSCCIIQAALPGVL